MAQDNDISFGDVDWNSGDVKEGGGKTDFMRLTQGSNTVRVMGNPFQYYVHWVESSNGKRKFNCPTSDMALVRQLENAGFKKQPRWLVKVLDRADGKFKILEIGSQVYTGIKALVNNEKWGPVTAYDITIERGPAGQQPLYRVTPDPKEALESKYKAAFADFNEKANLEKLTAAAEPSAVREFMGWEEEVAPKTSKTTKKPQVQTEEEDEDISFNFKS